MALFDWLRRIFGRQTRKVDFVVRDPDKTPSGFLHTRRMRRRS